MSALKSCHVQEQSSRQDKKKRDFAVISITNPEPSEHLVRIPSGTYRKSAREALFLYVPEGENEKRAPESASVSAADFGSDMPVACRVSERRILSGTQPPRANARFRACEASHPTGIADHQNMTI